MTWGRKVDVVNRLDLAAPAFDGGECESVLQAVPITAFDDYAAENANREPTEGNLAPVAETPAPKSLEHTDS
jgi:hypothetical protein